MAFVMSMRRQQDCKQHWIYCGEGEIRLFTVKALCCLCTAGNINTPFYIQCLLGFTEVISSQQRDKNICLTAFVGSD